MKKQIKLLGVIVGLACFVFGSISAKAPSETGVLMVRMNTSNVPSEFEEINVDIESVALGYGQSSNSVSWVELVSNVGVINLLEYRTTPILLSDGAKVGTGRIAQIKVNFGPNNTAVLDGRSYPVKLADMSGTVIDLGKVIDDSDHVEIMLNMDIAKSITTDEKKNVSLSPSIRMSSMLPFK